MDEVLKELAELREENKILRDSLVETRSGSLDEDGGADRSRDGMLREIADMLGSSMDQVKAYMAPGTEQLTAQLRHQLDENPVPLLLAAFGAGYLISRGRDRT